MYFEYCVEMVCDYIAAGKIYEKEKFNKDEPLEYFDKNLPERHYHKDTEKLVRDLLKKYSELDEEEFIKYFNENKEILEKEYYKK